MHLPESLVLRFCRSAWRPSEVLTWILSVKIYLGSRYTRWLTVGSLLALSEFHLLPCVIILDRYL